MIETGESGLQEKVLARFLEALPALDSLDLFPERFTLELRTRSGSFLFHVNRGRAVVRPVVPEDSRKKLISLPLSHFVRLVEYGDESHWAEALEEGHIRIDW